MAFAANVLVLALSTTFQVPDEAVALDPTAMARVDELVASFMERYELPALSLAFARDGRIVLAKGYGYADVERKVPVTPAHLFRVASVSKPITAVALMELVERGELALDARVFGEGALLGMRYGTAPYDARVAAITVEHLLTHTAGGWPNDGTDPMFRRPELEHAELIGWVLDSYELAHEPGSSYAYSNFGYCVLGRVIEAVHGKPYAESVRELVLEPAGIGDMQVAGDTLEARRANEVVYVQPGADPYGMRVARMDAHGGWLASPAELVRLALRVDGFDTVPDLLEPATIRAMTTPSAANPRYAKGWSVNAAGNWWHMGSLPGTGSILVRASNGYCWAVVTSRCAGGNFGRDLDALPWRVVDLYQD